MRGNAIRGALLGAALLAAAVPVAADPGGRRTGSDDAIPLRVTVIDGITGGPIAGASVSLRRGDGAPRLLVQRGEVFVLEDTGFERGQPAGHRIELALPDGWVQEEESRDTPPPVTLFTRSLERTVVAWPEARILVEVVDPAGAPVEGAILRARFERAPLGATWGTTGSSRYGSRSWTDNTGSGTTGVDGTGLLRGIPAIPGVSFRALVFDKFSEVLVIEDPATEHRVRVQVERPGRYIGGGGILCRRGCPGGISPRRRGDGTLEVRVFRLDGSAAAGVRVLLGYALMTTEPGGVAVFRDLPEGTASVEVWEPGFLSPGPTDVRIEAGRVVRVAIREVPGRSIVLRVVDGDGRPLPGAFVRCDSISWPYAPVDGRGVQSLDLVTGAAGLVLLPRVPAGALRVEVTRGAERKHATIEGDSAEVMIR